MATRMLIDARHREETRVAVVQNNRIEEFDFESEEHKQLKGNIYLAKVTRVEPSLQAAFVDYGGNRHGFLAFSEIHPDYYQIPKEDREKLLAEEVEQAKEEAELRESEDDEHIKSDAGEDGEETEWELEFSGSVNGSVRQGVNAEFFQIGDQVKAAGVVSRRDPTSIGLLHLLLPSGEEMVSGNRELRWSDGWWICDCGIEMTVSEGRQVLEEACAVDVKV